MALPIDLEDVVGVAVADTLRRAGMILFTIMGGAFLANLCILVGELVAWRLENGVWELGLFRTTTFRIFALPLRPMSSAWGILYVPFLIMTGFYFVRAMSPGMRSVAMFLTIAGVFAVLGRGEPEWFRPGWLSTIFGGATAVTDPGKLQVIIVSVGLTLWAGMGGSFWFFAWFWDRRNQSLAEMHLKAIAHENELRREEIRRRTGVAVGDREFAVGEGEDRTGP